MNKLSQIFLLLVLTTIGLSSSAQDTYFTRSGVISFFSSTPLEDIEAVNESVNVILKSDSGDVAFKLLMTGFEFDKAAMEEHFNDQYVESEKFPKATFEGQIQNFHELDFSKDETQQVKVLGTLNLHGVEKEIQTKGTIKKAGEQVDLRATFKISLADYDVKVPSNFVKKINDEIEIKVNADLMLYVR